MALTNRRHHYLLLKVTMLTICGFVISACGGGGGSSTTKDPSGSGVGTFKGGGTITTGNSSSQRILSGEFYEDITLSADVEWYLDKGVFIGGDNANSATITIEPGTVVRGLAGTPPGMLVVRRGSKIEAVGTSSKPIVFTSAQTSPAPGDWGGLVINGNAPINNTGGTAQGEGSSGTYGGSNATDSSGTLKYVRVEYAGSIFTADDELNGIAFQGVGSGTEIDYIQIHRNKDDGIEFFGGTVNVKHVVLTGCVDDSMDWTGGWTGKAQYVLVKQADDQADRGMECDNSSSDNNASPRSQPTISNVTLIGGANGDTGMMIRAGTGLKIYNGVVTGFRDAGVDIDDATTFTVASAGNLVIQSFVFYNNNENFENGEAEDPTATYLTDFMAASSHILETATNPLTGTYLTNAPSVTATDVSSIDSFFESTNFVGAVNSGSDWTSGWVLEGSLPKLEGSAIGAYTGGGIISAGSTSSQKVMTGEFKENITLTSDTEWFLDKGVFIGGDNTNSATITIEPGTVIRGLPGTPPGMLVIRRGSKIEAAGTKSAPIVFTSAQSSPAAGDWGGLVINGNAPINNTGGTAQGEGSSGTYGGSNATDSSGTLKYVRVEYAGSIFTADDELNGIAFQGVGSGTEVDYIQIHRNKDDGIEFFGGTVNVKHVVLTGCVDDSMDWTGGWTGKAQFVLVHQADDQSDRGMECDNSSSDNNATPRSQPTIANVTLIGGTNGDTGILVRAGTGLKIYNGIISSFKDDGFDIDDATTFTVATAGNLVVQSFVFFNNTNNFEDGEAEDPTTTYVSTHIMTTNINNVETTTDPLTGTYLTNSPSVTVTDVSAIDSFFVTTDFIGAVKSSDDWTSTWVKSGSLTNPDN